VRGQPAPAVRALAIPSARQAGQGPAVTGRDRHESHLALSVNVFAFLLRRIRCANDSGKP